MLTFRAIDSTPDRVRMQAQHDEQTQAAEKESSGEQIGQRVVLVAAACESGSIEKKSKSVQLVPVPGRRMRAYCTLSCGPLDRRS